MSQYFIIITIIIYNNVNVIKEDTDYKKSFISNVHDFEINIKNQIIYYCERSIFIIYNTIYIT